MSLSSISSVHELVSESSSSQFDSVAPLTLGGDSSKSVKYFNINNVPLDLDIVDARWFTSRSKHARATEDEVDGEIDGGDVEGFLVSNDLIIEKTWVFH